MSCWLCGLETTELSTNPKEPICENGPCQICNAVAKVDEEINQAVAALRRLIDKRCDLRSEQNRVHGTLIHRLPVELKNYIFELLLPSRDEWGEFSHTELSVMPSYFGSVCRGWRDVVWSNPSFWTTIHIVLGQESTSGALSRIGSVNDWILRSRSLPLQIVLRDEGGSKEQFKAVIDAISQCSSRWHSLSLDLPWTLNAYLPSNLQCRSLKKLRIICRKEWIDIGEQSGPLFLYPVTPEEIEISGVVPRSLQISWNHLTFAKVTNFDFGEIAQLLGHAPLMTHFQVWSPSLWTTSMRPIIHRRLKVFGTRWDKYPFSSAASLLTSLTLPSLQEFHTNAMITLKYLPALVQRSSCLLTKLRLFKDFGDESPIFDSLLSPLPGVTNLVVETLDYDPGTISKLLLDGYFPDMRHLTLRLEPFRFLLDSGAISPLLDLKQPRHDRPYKGKLHKFLVIDHAYIFDDLWDSDLGERLKAVDISLMKNGFEFLWYRTSICITNDKNV